MPTVPRIFISYARSDGEAFAKNLRRRLTEEHGFSLWQDRSDLEGGKNWWQQIVEAIQHVEYLVLVMTPASMQSDVVRREWRLARQEGVCVVPVIGAPQFDFASLPRWMRDTHFVSPDVPEQWTRLIRTLESPCQSPRVPFMVEELPDDFVPRPAEYEALVTRLFDERREEPIAITTALRGAGGYGKTTLAKAVCHDERIQEAFHDGILWVTLGQQPDVLAGLTKLYDALMGEQPRFVDVEHAANRLAQAWEDRACLIVIDDVWNEAHLRPFLRGGRKCARLITTRNSATLPMNAQNVSVDAMQQAEAAALLNAGLPLGQEEVIRKLAARLGEWPVLLKLVNGTLRDRVHNMGQTLAAALAYAKKVLDKRGLTAFDPRNAVERKQAVAITIDTSLEHLTAAEQARYGELVIFPEDVDIPLGTVAKLWGATGGLDDLDTEELCTRLNQLSLLHRCDLTTQQIRLHDVIRTYLEEKHGQNLAAIHDHLLSTHSQKKLADLPATESYLWRYLAYHLLKAGRTEELRRVLRDFDWLWAKLKATDVASLLADYSLLPDDAVLRLIRGAIRLSAHVVAQDKTQFAGQLLGRLFPGGSPELEGLRNQIKQWRGASWIRPLIPNLTAPGGPLLHTLTGHTHSLRAVAVMPDGRRAISASDDCGLKIWSLESGAEQCTLIDHTQRVTAVVVMPDGRYAVSASGDQTLKVWDLERGVKQCSLMGHTGDVRALAVTPDGRYVISGSADRTLRMWDIARGEEQRLFIGHTSRIRAVTVTPDGKHIISASSDGVLKIWAFGSGTELLSVDAHRVPITALSVTPDGQCVITASDDHTLKVWDLARGVELQTLNGHTAVVISVAVTSDGRYAISASADRSIKIWDLATGKEQNTFTGHTGSVNAVTVTPDGRYVISASSDHTLKVWDIAGGTAQHDSIGHNSGVNAVAVTQDGLHAISASEDHTLKVWNVETGTERLTLQGHTSFVNAVAVRSDGSQAISGSSDHTLKVWDLNSGSEQLTLAGHTRTITAVAVHPDGRHAISASADYTLKIWDLVSGEERDTLKGHTQWVNAVAVMPDGRRAISASDDYSLKVWDLETRVERPLFEEYTHRVNAVVVTPNGQHAITASDDHTLKVWDLETGTIGRILRGHTAPVSAVAVTSDGRHAISVSYDGTLKVWSLVDGKIVASFTGESALVACAIAPDGVTLVAGEQSGRIHFLRLEGMD